MEDSSVEVEEVENFGPRFCLCVCVYVCKREVLSSFKRGQYPHIGRGWLWES